MAKSGFVIRVGGIFVGIAAAVCAGGSDVEKLREMMVKHQIEARGVRDPKVLHAMRTVERHKFVPSHQVSSAYEDHPLPIGHGQTISQPYIVALMTELCELNGTEKVLEIGTGSGYQAAILSLLAKEVYSIELIEALATQAAKRLKDLGYRNVTVKCADGYLGWPEKAPFDVIMLTAAPVSIPQTLVDQLKDDGGILVAPVGDFFQELVRVRKINGRVYRETITHVRFVPMVPGSSSRN
ncbi:MAG: protein-L-isoaspartate(D-aspartate) O-methyltransferase [Spirochaetes bacterium]|nr:protein-L-isoaspartate(D-aspartate) O-methyltransferase [Spirochaetota bacterium]